MVSPEERSARARIAAYTKHAKHNPAETCRVAREAFDRRFLDEVDPDRTLPEDERNRRATYARKAYYARLALKSAQARRARKASAV